MIEAELQTQFPIGSQVYTRSAPHGRPGQVTGHFRGKILVCFPSIGGYCAAFKPEILIHEGDAR